MELEERGVLHSRLNIIKQWNDKEWWYTGVYDPDTNVYFSFYFARVNLTDHFTFTVFDPAEKQPFQFGSYLFLDSHQEKGRLCLNYRSKGFTVSYNGDEKNGWKFTFNNKFLDVMLDINATIPPFTKLDNTFTNVYTLLHFFQNRVSGFVRTKDKSYDIRNGLGYYDHCFGRVPGKSGWHWIAVQNRDTALSCAVNYGPYAQKYTQIYCSQSGDSPNRWVRLSQEVSFEHTSSEEPDSQWRATSPDMDLTITPLTYICNRTKIPPLLPFLINITHYEFFIRVCGRVRIDGHWAEIGDLYGVMEEHFGRW